MNAIKELSTVAESDFPDTWYEITADGHFWIEWRFQAFLNQLEALQMPLTAPWRGLDVGCGHGAVRRQIEYHSQWVTDGADVNRVALLQNNTRGGETFLYDVHQRLPELEERYDFVLLFDVLEHLTERATFLESVLYHLKPGGWLFVDVPALNSLLSGFDRAVGHLRRYNKLTLQAELDNEALDVRDIRYWGCSMLPYLVARKLLTAGGGSDTQMIECGMPPKPRFNNWITRIMTVECALMPNPPLGTSLLAAAVKRPRTSTARA